VNNRRKILEMLAEKKIDTEEADRLLSLIEGENMGEETKGAKSPKYLRVVIKPTDIGIAAGESENVNVRVPMALLRAGIKLTSIIPPSAYNEMDASLKEKGIELDLRNIKPENIEELIAALGDLEVNIDSNKQTVRVYAE
jgi:hypothetical protein